ncbi:MAG: hypothetical protein IT377_27015 [Polyangiaceae bacterium]|nr:hypothetical protein [Polyangiaceae bacterium]
MPPDREAILSRRALFVAAALTGITMPGHADETRLCPPPLPPSAEDREAARALFQEARVALGSDDPARAAELGRKAYELTRLPKLLLFLAEAEQKAGDLTRAHAHLTELAGCADSAATLQLAQLGLAQLERVSAAVTLQGGAPGTNVEIDGKSVGSLPFAVPFRLAPGLHEIVLSGGPCGRELRERVEVEAGATQVIQIDPECAPRPCLQPCLSPPPPPPPDALPRFGLGAGTLGYIGTRQPPGNEPGVAIGARVEAFYAAPLGDAFVLHLGVAALPGGSSVGALVPVGADAALVVAPGSLRLGLGVTSGWMFATARNTPGDAWSPRSSFFMNPYVQPLGMRLSDHFEAAAQVGLLLGTWANTSDETFRAGFITTSLSVRVYLGGRDREFDDVARR